MRPIVCVLVLAAGLAAGAGCGADDGTIPSSSAEQLQERLDNLRASFDEGRCTAAGEQVAGLQRRVEGLDVPRKLRENLRDGINKLDSAIASQCQDAVSEEPAKTVTTETQTTTTATTTTPTTTTPTTTTPTTTTPTVPAETTPTEPTGGVEPGDEGDFGGGDQK